jgi:4-hydroxybutyrate dehydrogenase
MGQLSIWSFPTRVLFGAGAAGETGNEVKRLGAKRALIVTDKGVVGAGLVAPVEQALASAGIAMTVFADVDSNPVEKNVHDGVLAYRETKSDIIVAVGGGSPLDVGKIIRLKAARRIRRCDRGRRLHHERYGGDAGPADHGGYRQ